MKKIKFAVILFFCILAFRADALQYRIFDHNFEAALPPNYCTLDENTDFYKFNKLLLSRSIKNYFIASDCDNVRKLQEGKIKTLPHYIAFEQVGIDGKFNKFNFGRFVYLKLITAFKPKSLKKLTDRVNDKLKNNSLDYTVDNLDYEIGTVTDKFASYKGSANLSYDGKNKKVVVLALSTLVTKIPIAIHTYDEDPTEDDIKMSIEELKLLYQSVK